MGLNANGRNACPSGSNWPNAIHDDGPKSTCWRRPTKRDVFSSF